MITDVLIDREKYLVAGNNFIYNSYKKGTCSYIFNVT